jgi:DNA-binding response OmpR family regulator
VPGDFKRFREEISGRLKVLEESLEAARERSTGAEDSVRRIARSLAQSAKEHGFPEIHGYAENLAAAESRRQLFARARIFLLKASSEPTVRTAAQATVLIVEDDRTTGLLLESFISHESLRSFVAGSVAEADQLMNEHPIDLILLDLVLPDADGRDFLLKVRERRSTAETPVIVLSARPASQAKAECIALGAQEYLEKPADPELTRSAVHTKLRRAMGGEPDGPPGRPAALANRADLAEAFEAAREADLASDRRDPLSMASIELDRLSGLPEAEMEANQLEERRVMASLIRGALRPSDLLAADPNGKLLALLPRTGPEEAAALLDRAQISVTEGDEPKPPPSAGSPSRFSAGVADVSMEPTLTEAIARADRMLYLTRSPGVPRILASIPDAVPSERKILLVEDDRVTARLILHRLRRDGFDVIHFTDGLEAFEAARGESVSVAIFDVKLPGMDGFELLQRVRELPNFSGVPVLMLTSMGREADIVRGFDLGADDYVLKPFSPVELVARIHRLLDG